MFFEISIDGGSFRAAGFRGRDELEDPLDEHLRAIASGEVTGGGSGESRLNIDVELTAADEIEEGARLLLSLLGELGAPAGTIVRSALPNRKEWILK